MNHQYMRFKTVEEFKKEFGPTWHNHITCGWGDEMTKLLAGEIFYHPINPTEDSHITGYKTYTISLPMLTPLEEERVPEAEKVLKEVVELLSKVTVKTSTDSNYCIVSYNKSSGSYGTSFGIYNNITDNCQLGSISSFNSLLQSVSSIELCKKIIEAAVSKCGWHKKLYLIDVHDRYLDMVRPILYNEPTLYTSTNKSKMMYGLIRLFEN